MNRLIIIGNGFDLAHGLKTSYNDFILWYTTRCFVSAKLFQYQDPLISIAPSQRNRRLYYDEEIVQYVANLYEHCFVEIVGESSYSFDFDDNKNSNEPFLVTVNSTLLLLLLKNCSTTKWVDIEGEFYGLLTDILNSSIGITDKEKKLTELNQSLRFIIEQLHIYLETLPPSEYIEEYMDIFCSKIRNEDLIGVPIIEEEPEDTLLLNFNYTNTIIQYLQSFKQNSGRPVPGLNYIHGKLSEPRNPLVFGFGDELDEAYALIEKEKAKGYFEYIKSFWYFRTPNYRDLVRFLDASSYQVYVLGHSCGLSDRTMLNMIFEHDNCESIKIYYHGDSTTNNYTSVTHEIARHFKDKSAMRKKIVSLDKSYPMPQAK